MKRTLIVPSFRTYQPLFLVAALVLAPPLGCSSSTSGGNQGGGGGEEAGSGGSAGSGGKGGSAGSGGKGGSAGSGGVAGSSGSGGAAGNGGTGGSGGTGGAAGSGGTGGAAGSGGKGGAGTDAGTGGTGVDAGGGTADGGLADPFACIGGTCQNPTCMPLGGKAMPLEKYPEIGFEPQPSYIPNNMVIPTFDDAPDGLNSPADPSDGAGEWTIADLKFFDANNMHVDFFINTENYCGDITQDPACLATLKSILTNHYPANHTVHHIHMGGNTPPDPTSKIPDSCGGAMSGVTCDVEVSGVEKVINTVSNGARPHLTRFRPPYGEPYQAMGAGLAAVQAVVSKYSVAVGWNMDSGDSADCTAPCFTGAEIVANVKKLLGTGPGKGAYGVLLMHGTHRWTNESLKPLFDPQTGYLATAGFKVATVEDVVCWKYGMHSWEVVQKLNNQPRSPN